MMFGMVIKGGGMIVRLCWRGACAVQYQTSLTVGNSMTARTSCESREWCGIEGWTEDILPVRGHEHASRSCVQEFLHTASQLVQVLIKREKRFQTTLVSPQRSNQVCFYRRQVSAILRSVNEKGIVVEWVESLMGAFSSRAQFTYNEPAQHSTVYWQHRWNSVDQGLISCYAALVIPFDNYICF